MWRHLAGVLDELLPLRVELLASDDVYFPVFVVVGDQVAALGEVRQNRLDNDDSATSVQLLVTLRLTRAPAH